ncbi:MAG: hypothetical protein DVS81_02435 [Candidatus Accumulibacter meliphilus]|jgi:tellurite resistance protein|uniref:Co-chaperone DjlA N-terminal domain-containing protein n=1 Tax=Candidatus Accumulibacter meliphilus TaxID=2211374 RepID=A0A369XUM8_9PROT|nr:MAG: hypothetical protein DVS81_02435 [Candidatus Accumulibacter meliphilus]
MFPQFDDVSLNVAQTVAATQILLRIAHVDGTKSAEEVALIGQFYDACRNAALDWPAFASLQTETPAGNAAGLFTAPAQRDMLVATCLLVAYADGALIDKELAAVREVAAEIGMAGTRVDELLALVKDYMLAQLARLPDADSVAVVARELG